MASPGSAPVASETDPCRVNCNMNVNLHHNYYLSFLLGVIPEWIEGSLYRNGPAKFEIGDTKFNHWFDGMAMIHRFKISKGKVTYQDRFIESEVYRKNMQANRIICSEFGTVAFPDPCKTWYEK